VTYTLERYLPQSVTLQTAQHQGPPNSDGTAPIVTDFDQNPVFVELQPTAEENAETAAEEARRTAKAAACAGQYCRACAGNDLTELEPISASARLALVHIACFAVAHGACRT
jgi:hypothetical protein